MKYIFYKSAGARLLTPGLKSCNIHSRKCLYPFADKRKQLSKFSDFRQISRML